MLRSNRVRIAAAGMLAAVPYLLRAAAARADYPDRTITFVVGFAPGGGIDTFARVIAQALGDRFGYRIVVENRAGAASNIAAKAVAAATADGYTLLFTGMSPMPARTKMQRLF